MQIVKAGNRDYLWQVVNYNLPNNQNNMQSFERTTIGEKGIYFIPNGAGTGSIVFGDKTVGLVSRKGNWPEISYKELVK